MIIADVRKYFNQFCTFLSRYVYCHLKGNHHVSQSSFHCLTDKYWLFENVIYHWNGYRKKYKRINTQYSIQIYLYYSVNE